MGSAGRRDDRAGDAQPQGVLPRRASGTTTRGATASRAQGVIAYKHSRGAGALTPKTDDYRLVDPRAEEREKHEAAIMEATAKDRGAQGRHEGYVSKRRRPGGE